MLRSGLGVFLALAVGATSVVMLGCGAAVDGAPVAPAPSAATPKTIQDPAGPCSGANPACRVSDVDFDQNDQDSGAIDHYGDGVIYNASSDGIQVNALAAQLQSDTDNDGVPNIADECPGDPTGWALNDNGECTDEGVYVELSGTPDEPEASKDAFKRILFDFFKTDVYVLAEASSDSFLAAGGMLGDVLTRGTVSAGSDADLANRLATCQSRDLNNTGVVGAAHCILPGSWFGVGQFTDYNINRDNQLYFHMLDMTDDVTDVRRAADKMAEEKYAESANGATQALWAMATGTGLGNYLPNRGVCPSYTDGAREGWPCFRPDSVKVAVLLHFAPFHNGPSGAQWTDSTGTVHNIGTFPYDGGSLDSARAQPANMVPVQTWPQLLYNDGPRTLSSPRPDGGTGIFDIGDLTRSVAYNTNTLWNRSTVNPAGRFRGAAIVDHDGVIGDCAVTGSIHQYCGDWWSQTFTFCQQINGSWISYNTLAQAARGNSWFHFHVPASLDVLIHTHGSDRDMALGTFFEGAVGSWNPGPMQLECNDYGGYHGAIQIANGSGYTETSALSDATAAIHRTFAPGGYYAVVSSIGVGGKWPMGGPAGRGGDVGDGNIRLTFDTGSGYERTHAAGISWNDTIATLTNRGIKVIDIPLTLNGACPSTPGWIASWIPTSWTQSLDQLLKLIYFPGTSVGGVLASMTGAVDVGGNPASYATCAGAAATQTNVLRALRDITYNTPFDLYVVPSRDQSEGTFPDFDDRNLIARIPASASVADAMTGAGGAKWNITPTDCGTCGSLDGGNNMCRQCLTGANPEWKIHFANSGSAYDPVSNPNGTALQVDGSPMVRKLWLDLYADSSPGQSGGKVFVKRIPVRVLLGRKADAPAGTFTLLYDTARDPDPNDPNVGPICTTPPERPRWMNLDYDAKIPIGTQLQFEFKTANAAPDMADPSKVTTVTVPVQTTGNFDGTGSIDVNALFPADAKQRPVLQIQAKLVKAPLEVVAALTPPRPGRLIGVGPNGWTTQVTRGNTVTRYGIPKIEFNAPPTFRPYPGLSTPNNFSLYATADLIVRKAGTYQFAILSDDGARLTIDGTVRFNTSSWSPDRHKVSVYLSEGRHSIELNHNQGSGGYNIRLEVGDPTKDNNIYTDADWRPLDPIDRIMPGVTEAGFTVKVVNQAVNSFAAAEAALASHAGVTETGVDLINYNDGGQGWFWPIPNATNQWYWLHGVDRPFPGDPDGIGGNTGGFNPVTLVTAQLRVPTAGTYRFGSWADDAKRLRIDGQRVFSNTSWDVAAEGDVYLTQGVHDLELLSYDSGGGGGLEFFMIHVDPYGHGDKDGYASGARWQLVTRVTPEPDPTMPGISDEGFTATTVHWNGVWNLNDANWALTHGAGVTETNLDTINFEDSYDNYSFGEFPDTRTYPGDPDGTAWSNYAFSPVTKVTGQLVVPAAGTYRFGVLADDQAQVKINGQVVIGVQWPYLTRYEGSITFAAPGTYPLEVISYDGNKGAGLELTMQARDGSWHLLSWAAGSTMLFLDTGNFVRVHPATHDVIPGSLTDVGSYFPGMDPYKTLIRGAWRYRGKIYFFLKGTATTPPRIARVDWALKTLDSGYPKTFASEFPALAAYQGQIRSFALAPNKAIYVHLSDGRYLAFDPEPPNNLTSSTYPAPISDANWPGLQPFVPEIGAASEWAYGVDVWLRNGDAIRYDWPPSATSPWPAVHPTAGLQEIATVVPTLRKMHFEFYCQEVE